eukprot:TRINITY_DN5039_c0_g1_i2.p1 TRINITY_DN5039_c0_g1~~TRINITY_DN5039_c0_g1_i2.p1  ORF type:complete len:182 (-),score=58.09 TRINITY_DN5039_c0_g1_i2:3-488(-)
MCIRDRITTGQTWELTIMTSREVGGSQGVRFPNTGGDYTINASIYDGSLKESDVRQYNLPYTSFMSQDAWITSAVTSIDNRNLLILHFRLSSLMVDNTVANKHQVVIEVPTKSTNDTDLFTDSLGLGVPNLGTIDCQDVGDIGRDHNCIFGMGAPSPCTLR